MFYCFDVAFSLAATTTDLPRGSISILSLLLSPGFRIVTTISHTAVKHAMYRISQLVITKRFLTPEEFLAKTIFFGPQFQQLRWNIYFKTEYIF